MENRNPYRSPNEAFVLQSKMFGPLARQYDGIEVHDQPEPGDVQFVYHTYHGFLVFFIQNEHRVSCSPQNANLLLGRLLRFNLTWGMLSYGLVFVPFVAFFNYLSQKRSIRKQAARPG
jgi:hypothetical protein